MKGPGTLPGVPQPLHHVQNLHTTLAITDPFQSWGRIVEALWHISMILDHRIPVWDMLTSRLLIWQSIVGEEGSLIGERAQKESIGMLWLY
jgi:nucleolar pre-ribosomal-associated protein 1